MTITTYRDAKGRVAIKRFRAYQRNVHVIELIIHVDLNIGGLMRQYVALSRLLMSAISRRMNSPMVWLCWLTMGNLATTRLRPAKYEKNRQKTRQLIARDTH